jgi:DNA-binding NtrC family response regulator
MTDAMPAPSLRVLVVEDDYHVAQSLERRLASLGCTVVGAVATAEDACGLLKERDVDAAVLDIRLSPGTSAPVARALRYRGCPFVFISGFSTSDVLPDDLRGHRILQKPVDEDTLRSAVDEMARARAEREPRPRP